jgi:SAM-dependent methyltransferase
MRRMTSSYDAGAFDEFEAAAWTRRAQAYADRVMALTAAGVDPLLDAAGVAEGLRVLDVGCGPGTVSAAAVSRGALVIGVDAAEPMVRIAGERVPRATFRVGTVAALPADDETFDCVVAGFVLLHVGTPELMATEAARVCAPGGRVAFSVWDDLGDNRVLGVVQDAVARLGDELAPVDVPPGPAFTRFADDDAMRELLAGAGLAGVEVTRHHWDHVVDAGDWWDAVVRGTARTAAVIEAQDAKTQARIRAVYDELVAPYARPDGTVGLPAAMVVGSGSRP